MPLWLKSGGGEAVPEGPTSGVGVGRRCGTPSPRTKVILSSPEDEEVSLTATKDEAIWPVGRPREPVDLRLVSRVRARGCAVEETWTSSSLDRTVAADVSSSGEARGWRAEHDPHPWRGQYRIGRSGCWVSDSRNRFATRSGEGDGGRTHRSNRGASGCCGVAAALLGSAPRSPPVRLILSGSSVVRPSLLRRFLAWRSPYRCVARRRGRAAASAPHRREPPFKDRMMKMRRVKKRSL